MLQDVFELRRRTMALLCFISLSLAVAGTGHAAPSTGAAARPLVIGVLPFISPIALLKRFAPLRDHLDQSIGQPILMETARDYSEFVRRTAVRRYDILITAPHFVPLAVDTRHYQVIATFANLLTAVVVVPADSKVTQLADLAGYTVATPPEQAIVTWVGQDLLQEQIGADRAPRYRAYPSHNAALSAVMAGEVDAAVITVSVINKHRTEGKRVRILAHSKPFPAMGILMASDLPPELRAQVAATLVAMSETETGRAVLERIAYAGYRAAANEDFEPLRRYLPRVRSMLEPQS